MKLSKRHDQILRILAQRGEVSVEALAKDFQVSIMTIRRDLAELDQAGRIQRTHGGALPVRTGLVEFSFQEKQNLHSQSKQAIAQEVAKRVHSGMAISLDHGTTTFEVARAIARIEGVTVLTTSLPIASVLYANETIDLILLGGAVRKNNPNLTGLLAEENVQRFRVHLAVLGADAITTEGTFSTDLVDVRLCRAMCRSANQVVLVADSSKFHQTALVKCLEFSQIHHVITDDDCPPEVRRWLAKAVKQVTYAKVEKAITPLK